MCSKLRVMRLGSRIPVFEFAGEFREFNLYIVMLSVRVCEGHRGGPPQTKLLEYLERPLSGCYVSMFLVGPPLGFVRPSLFLKFRRLGLHFPQHLKHNDSGVHSGSYS